MDNWAAKHSGIKVPESAFYDFNIMAAIGYGESKYIAEQLLENAATTSGLLAVVCRVGQLVGTVVNVGRVWNKQEWLPSVSPSPIPWSHLLLTYLYTQTNRMNLQLIASSTYLGQIPSNLPGQDAIPWLPVDITATIILELSLSPSPPHLPPYPPSHPGRNITTS